MADTTAGEVEEMVKQHTIKLNIRNDTTIQMTYHSMWFGSGRVADHFAFPKVINPNENHTIVCYERDWALSGCSGYVVYNVNNKLVTIAFSNPSAGTNKVGAGIGNATQVWNKIASHDYQDFTIDLKLDTIPLMVHCKCSGGTTNDATVVFHLPSSYHPPPGRYPPNVNINVQTGLAYPPPPYNNY